VMDSDGSNPHNLTRHPDRDDFPVWHPDGRRILFISERDGGSDLYLLTMGTPSVGASPAARERK